MKIRNFFLSVFAVVVMAASPLTAQVLISNNFDGDDSNDLGGAFVIGSNDLEDQDMTDPANGLISFLDEGNSNPNVGITSSAAADFSGFDGFTVEWVVAEGFSTGDIASNGWFFGVQTAPGIEGDGSTLWNNLPDAVGVTLFPFSNFARADFAESFALNGNGENFTRVDIVGGAPTLNEVAEDGFTITLTLNSDDTWSVSSEGLDAGSGELSGSGTLVSGNGTNPPTPLYATFANNLFASSFFQVNSQREGASGEGATPATVGGQFVSVTVTGFMNPQVLGDFDGDMDVDCDDLDGYIGNIGASVDGVTRGLANLDFDGDGMLTMGDAISTITDLVVASNGITGTLVGDFNCDGSVDVLNDAFALVANLSGTATSYSQGDTNFDGAIDVLNDGFTLVGNLGSTNEPATTP